MKSLLPSIGRSIGIRTRPRNDNIKQQESDDTYLLLPAGGHVGAGAVTASAAGADDVHARLLDAAARVVETALQRDLSGVGGGVGGGEGAGEVKLKEETTDIERKRVYVSFLNCT